MLRASSTARRTQAALQIRSPSGPIELSRSWYKGSISCGIRLKMKTDVIALFQCYPHYLSLGAMYLLSVYYYHDYSSYPLCSLAHLRTTASREGILNSYQAPVWLTCDWFNPLGSTRSNTKCDAYMSRDMPRRPQRFHRSATRRGSGTCSGCSGDPGTA